tara:strand:+ start:461 stop:613 length:153 start_codon:yes stop_codon:yes gene_type:complete
MDRTNELIKIKLRINQVLNNMVKDKNFNKEIYTEVVSIGNKIGRIANNKA